MSSEVETDLASLRDRVATLELEMATQDGRPAARRAIPVASTGSVSPEDDWSAFPSLSLAYTLVQTSYDVPMKRLEAMDNRLGALITAISTVSLGLTGFLKGSGVQVSYTNVSFLAAMGLALLAVLAGLIARHTGELTVLSLPAVLDNGFLGRSEMRFRNDIFMNAVEHYKANVALVKKKATVLDLITVAFLVEVGLLIQWLT